VERDLGDLFLKIIDALSLRGGLRRGRSGGLGLRRLELLDALRELPNRVHARLQLFFEFREVGGRLREGSTYESPAEQARGR
jgi:hypothetical protein